MFGKEKTLMYTVQFISHLDVYVVRHENTAN